MTRDQIQAIFARVLTWPKERQEDAARVLLEMEADTEACAPDVEDLADLDAAEAEIQRGEPPASDEEVRAFFDSVRRT